MLLQKITQNLYVITYQFSNFGQLICGPGIPGVDDKIRDFIEKRDTGKSGSSELKQCTIDFCTMDICVMHKTGQEDLSQWRRQYFMKYTELIMLYNPKNHTSIEDYSDWLLEYERLHDSFLFYRPTMLLVECRSNKSEMNKTKGETRLMALAKEMQATWK